MTIVCLRSIRSVQRRALELACAVVCLAMFCAPVAAQTRNVAGAAEAFNKAQQAELRGEFQEAASLYTLADEMAPADGALRGAARTAQKAGMNATAATHAAALLARSTDEGTRALAEEILRENEKDLGRLHVSCNVACRVLIEGRVTASRMALEHVLYARPGMRAISASFESGDAPAQSVSLLAGSGAEVQFTAPSAESSVALGAEAAPIQSEPGRKKLSPWYMGSLAALTLVAGGVTIWSGMAVKSAHDDYDRRSASAAQDYDEGRKLEKQTDALIGVTAGLAVATATLAFFTDFRSSKSQDDRAQKARTGSLSLGSTRKGGMLRWSRSF